MDLYAQRHARGAESKHEPVIFAAEQVAPARCRVKLAQLQLRGGAGLGAPAQEHRRADAVLVARSAGEPEGDVRVASMSFVEKGPADRVAWHEVDEAVVVEVDCRHAIPPVSRISPVQCEAQVNEVVGCNLVRGIAILVVGAARLEPAVILLLPRRVVELPIVARHPDPAAILLLRQKDARIPAEDEEVERAVKVKIGRLGQL